MVRYADETKSDYNAFYSADFGTASSRPALTITYKYAYYMMSKNSPGDDHSFVFNQANIVPGNYQAYKHADKDAATMLAAMKISTVFVYRGDGTQTYVLAGNSTQMTRANVLAMPAGALSHVKLVLYACCEAGKDWENGANLVNATYNRGAKCVVGFGLKTYCPELNMWTIQFMQSLASGKTINAAMDAADAVVSNAIKNNVFPYSPYRGYTAKKYRTVCGNAAVSVS